MWGASRVVPTPAPVTDILANSSQPPMQRGRGQPRTQARQPPRPAQNTALDDEEDEPAEWATAPGRISRARVPVGGSGPEEKAGGANAGAADDSLLANEYKRVMDFNMDLDQLADAEGGREGRFSARGGLGAAPMEDEEDEEAAFSEAPAAGAGGPAVLSDESQQKIKLMTERLRQYRKRLKELSKRYAREHKEVQKLREELKESEELAEAALERAGQGGNMRMMRMGGAMPAKAAQNQDDGQRKRNELMQQLYRGMEVLEEEEQFEQFEDGQSVFLRLLHRLQRWVKAHQPLQGDVRTIEARFGSSVAAYFGFFRWIILNYIIMVILCAAFLTLHLANLITYSSSTSTERPFRTQYTWGSSAWTSVVGVLPRFLLFSSYNPGTGSSTDMGEQLGYIGLVACGVVFLLLSTLRKWVREDRRSKAVEMFEQQAGENKFAKLALNAWDHSITKENEVEDLKFAIAEQFVVALHEEDLVQAKGRRSLKSRLILYLRRVIGLMCYLLIQFLAGYAIILLTTTSSELSSQISSRVSWLGSLSNSIVPAAVSIINAMLPTIILRITKFEKWDDGGTHIKFELTRLFFAKLLNVLIQAFSFAQLADPFLLRAETYFGISVKSWRASTQASFSLSVSYTGGQWEGEPQCRADQVANGLFTVIFTEFLMGKLIGVTKPLGKGLIARIRNKPAPRDEFKVSESMVNLLYFQQLALVAFPYFPYSSLFCALFFYINFKFETWTLSRFMQKPLKPWSAKDSGSFFIKFYLSSIVVLIASSVFFLGNRTFPKECSKYNTDYAALYGDTTVDFSGLEERTFWYSTTSSASVANDGRLALLDASLITASSSLAEVANATATYMVQPAPDSDSPDLAFICPFACGPFVFSQNGYEPLRTFMKSTSVLSTVYSLLVENAITLFVIALILMVAYQFRSNTLIVAQRITVEKEQAMDTMVMSLQKKLRKLEKQTRLQKEKEV